MRIQQHCTKLILALLIFLGLATFSTQIEALSVPKGLAFDEARHLAFSALGGDVLIIDASDPANLALIADSIHTQGVVQDLCFDSASQLLYVAADEGDLEIWSIQDPKAPQQISVTALYYFGVETPVVSVDVVGNFAYVSTSWGYVHWLDVSDPAHPVDLGFNGIGGNPSREVFAADDGFVYLAGPDSVRYAINGDGSLSAAGTNIYATSYELFVNGGYAYISTGTGPMQILDANAGNLPFVSTYSTNNVKDIFVRGDYAYVANGAAGLRVLDVSDKSAPHEIGFEDSSGATNVVVASDYAYVRSGTTLRVVDVSAPSSPIVTGMFDASGSAGNIAPVANAGLSQAVTARDRVTLDGSNSYDPDGMIVGYGWTQISGPTVQLSGANTVSASFRAPKVSRNQVVTLVFELKVTDDAGAEGSDQVTVSVLSR